MTMTFIYEYSLKMHAQTENELTMSSLSKVIVSQTDRQTDRFHLKHYHAASLVAKSSAHHHGR